MIRTLFLSLALLLSGCASIVSKSQYPVAINSAPDGARFVIKNARGQMVHSARTPNTVTLRSGAGYFKTARYTIEFDKPGFDSQVYTLSSSMDGWYIGNVLLGGLIGMLVVDPATGAMYRLPGEVSVSLTEVADAPDADGVPVVGIGTIDDVPAPVRGELILVQN